MPRIVRATHIALAALLSTAALGLIVGTATAGRLSVSNQNFRATWTSLEFETASRLGRVLCPTTFEGSFHNGTIVKTLGNLVGYITRAAMGGPETCIGGETTILTETLPWHITYNGFNGTLPTITGTKFNLIRVAFVVHIASANTTCLAASTAERPMRGTVNINGSGEALTLTPERSAQIPLTGGICALTRGVMLEDPGTVTVLGSASVITVTLI